MSELQKLFEVASRDAPVSHDGLAETLARVRRRRVRRRFTSGVVAMTIFAATAGVLWVTLTSRMGGASSSPAAGAEDQYRIVYSTLVGGGDNSEIHLVHGGTIVRLTDYPGADHSPRLSPDGTRIAFASSRDDPGNLDIYTMTIDGTDIRRLTTDPEIDTEPQWSPDGKRIAFQRSDGQGHWEIYVVNADGSEEARLTRNDVSDELPAWSPDGSRIAFQRYVGSNLEIFLMASDGSLEVRLTNLPGADRRPAWSPDGEQIAFVRVASDEGPGDIYVVEAKGGTPTPLTNDAAAEERPMWFSDGTRVAFLREEGGGWSLYSVDVTSGADAAVPASMLPEEFVGALKSGDILGIDLWGTLES